MRRLPGFLLLLSLPVWAQPEQVMRLLEQRKLPQALQLAKKQVASRPDAANYIALGECYWQLEQAEDSLRAFTAALRLKPGDPIAARRGLARAQMALGKLAEARLLYQQNLPGQQGLDQALTLNSLGRIAYQLHEDPIAEENFRKASVVLERLQDSNLGTVLDSLALALRRQNKNIESLETFRRALQIREQKLGPEHPLVADTLTHMAELDTPNTERDYQRALAILEKAMGANDPSLVGLLKLIGEFEESRGNLSQALRDYERALNLTAPGSRSQALVVDNLAGVYRQRGSWQEAESLFEHAHKLLVATCGQDSVEVGTNEANLGLCLQEHGIRLDQAAEAYQSALPKLRREAWSHDLLATALLGLAQLKLSKNDLNSAQTQLDEARRIWTQLKGENYPRRGLVDFTQGLIWHARGKYAEAEGVYRAALKEVGENDPELDSMLDSLARLQIDQSQLVQAQTLALQSLEQRRRLAANLLSYSSEIERLKFFAEFRAYNLLGTLGRPETLSAVLAFKGIVLDSLLEDRRLAAQNPGHQGQLQELTCLRQAWSKQRDANGSELKGEIERLEAALGAGVATRQALAIRPELVQQRLPAATALVEFVLYRHLSKGALPATRYVGAIVVPPAGPVQWVSLGAAAPIEERIHRYQLMLGSAQGMRNPTAGPTPDPAALLAELYQMVWSPVRQKLPEGTKEVVVSPDGELNFLSLASLLDSASGKFLGEQLLISYVASGRDLLAPSRVPGAKKMVVVCDPVFGQSRRQGGLPPLPGTAREGAALEQLARSRGYEVSTLSQRAAQESAVRALDSPSILHLATHGFLLGPEEAGTTVSLRLSALALCGAQPTLDDWSGNKYPDPDNDGILNGEEIGLMNLDKTWLVTLSACDTGAGQNVEGEGVLGLRRGFVQAGTQNLLMTLWPVADRETAEFMQDFYTQVLAGEPPRAALAQTQRQWLGRLKTSRSVFDAARLAGPFVLSFKGPP